jgi:8-oxo-dGTP pyrophosphatase MutT (NUDIX family)
VELPASVIVVPVLGEKILMVKQYRHPVGEISWEFPGGFIDVGEDHLTAAKRELKEETGFTIEAYHYLGKIAGNPGILNNFTHIYLANGAHQSGAQDFDQNEDIQTAWLSMKQVQELLKNNGIIQSLHAQAAFMSLLHLGKLSFQL